MRISLIIIFLLNVVLTNGQERKDVITGIVRDKNKNPIIGVSVYIKVNNRCVLGTTSDENGKYSLQVADGYTNVFEISLANSGKSHIT